MLEGSGPLIVGALAAFAIGGIAYVGLMPLLSGERQSEKRMKGVAAGKTSRAVRAGTSADELALKKKQVQENLKELEKRKAAKNKMTMRLRLMRSGIEATPRQFYITSAIVGLVVLAIGLVFMGENRLYAIPLAISAGFGLPRWVLNFLSKRRQNKFIDEFANAIDVIVRGVKSGLPLVECLEIIARETPEPVRGEFRELMEQQRIGVPLGECFQKMMDRVPLPEVSFFAIVVAIQSQAGGNLAEALGNLSGVLRSRKQLAAKVKALSSEAKASAAILAALPFIVMIMVYLTSPDYISLLWEDKMGHVFLAVAGFWMSAGIWVMRQMINFKY